MNQFRIKGIDYPDDSLEHGLGKGSGRGRPVGSKNGQVMPGAAYMKGYKITGHKAEELPVGDPRRVQLRKVSSGRDAAPNQQRQQRQTPTIKRAPRQTASPTTSTGGRTASVQRARVSSDLSYNPQVGMSNAASKVARGKSAIESLTGGNSSANQATAPVQRSRDMSTAELRALDPVGDWPWSERRVKAAGGIEAREGRQIVYDNPTLSEDYKKHIAKYYGDSDGKSYPKYLETSQTNQSQPAVNNPPQPSMPNQQTQPIRAVGNPAPVPGLSVNNAAQQIVGKPRSTDTSNNPPQPSVPNQQTNSVQAVGGPAQVPGRSVNNAAQQIAGQPRPTAAAPQNAQQTQQQPPANTPQSVEETPEQKSFWDNLGGWFSKTGKDIGDTVSGAWNTASGAVRDAAVWAGDRLKDAGDWAVTATGDVGQWVGDRAKDLDKWWNGEDYYEQVPDRNNPGVSRDVQARRTGAGEQIGGFFDDVGRGISNAAGDVGNWVTNAAGDVGRGISNAAGDVGNWVTNTAGNISRNVGNWLNGEDYYEQVPDPNNPGVSRDVQAHRPGVIQQIGQGISDASENAGNWLASVPGNADRLVNNLADNVLGRYPVIDTDENGNLVYGDQRQGGLVNRAALETRKALNPVGQAINGAAQGVNQFINGVQPGTPEAAPYYDLQTGQWVDPVRPDLGTRVGNWFQEGIVAPVTNAANGVGDFVRNTANNAGQTISNAANGAVDFVRNTADNAGQGLNDWWNGTDNRILGIPVSHNPGARENIGNAISNAGQTIGNAASNAWNGAVNMANNAGQAISNFASDAGDAIAATPGAAAGFTRALSSGVPLATANQLTSNYVNGQITREQYEESIDRLINEGGPWAP